MSDVDLGLSHIALPVSDLDESLAFYERFAGFEVVHRREKHPGQGVAWVSDRTRPFVVVLIETHNPAADARLGGWAHLGVGCPTRDEVDRRLQEAQDAGFATFGPEDDGPPVGYWGMIVDPDGHNLELAHGQQVGLAVRAPE